MDKSSRLGQSFSFNQSFGHLTRPNRPTSVRAPPIKLVSHFRWIARSTLSSFFLCASPQSSSAFPIDIWCRSATHPVTAMALLSSKPSDSPAPPCATSGTGQAIPPPSSPSVSYDVSRTLFPSTRVIAPSLADRVSVFSQIAALYHPLELQEAAVTDYRALEEAYRGQKLQIDRLHVELRSYVEIALHFAVHAQERYLSIWTDHQNLIERSCAFKTELARRLSQGDVIRKLKTTLLTVQADL